MTFLLPATNLEGMEHAEEISHDGNLYVVVDAVGEHEEDRRVVRFRPDSGESDDEEGDRWWRPSGRGRQATDPKRGGSDKESRVPTQQVKDSAHTPEGSDNESRVPGLVTTVGRRKRTRSEGGSRQSGRNPCMVCGRVVAKMGRHVISNHLPWFFQPDTACWMCEVQEGSLCFLQEKHDHFYYWEFDDRHLGRWRRLMLGLLYFLVDRVRAGSLQGLLAHVSRVGAFSEETLSPSPTWRHLLVQVEKCLGGRTDAAGMSFTPPNCAAAILNWHTMASLLAEMSTEEQYQVYQLEEEKDVEFSTGRVLVDLYSAPQIKIDEHPDLQISSRTRGNIGIVDQALIANSFGELAA